MPERQQEKGNTGSNFLDGEMAKEVVQIDSWD
jgi:hypothetical protein